MRLDWGTYHWRHSDKCQRALQLSRTCSQDPNYNRFTWSQQSWLNADLPGYVNVLNILDMREMLLSRQDDTGGQAADLFFYDRIWHQVAGFLRNVPNFKACDKSDAAISHLDMRFNASWIRWGADMSHGGFGKWESGKWESERETYIFRISWNCPCVSPTTTTRVLTSGLTCNTEGMWAAAKLSVARWRYRNNFEFDAICLKWSFASTASLCICYWQLGVWQIHAPPCNSKLLPWHQAGTRLPLSNAFCHIWYEVMTLSAFINGSGWQNTFFEFDYSCALHRYSCGLGAWQTVHELW